LTVFIY
jgi:hypothetical protein